MLAQPTTRHSKALMHASPVAGANQSVVREIVRLRLMVTTEIQTQASPRKPLQ